MIFVITQTDGKSFQVVWPSSMPPCHLKVAWKIKGTEAHGVEGIKITEADAHCLWRRIDTIPNEEGELEVVVTSDQEEHALPTLLRAWGPETRPFEAHAYARYDIDPGTTIVIPDGGIWSSINEERLVLQEGEKALVYFVSDAPLCRMTKQALSLDLRAVSFRNDGTNMQIFHPWDDAKQSVVPPSQGFIINNHQQ